jgi:hypothetical protein
MSDRITQKDLDHLVARINVATGSPMFPYNDHGKGSAPGKRYTPNAHNYHLDYAYGGVKLVRMCGEGSGISEISTGGFGTKRELYQWMQAFLAGLGER